MRPRHRGGSTTEEPTVDVALVIPPDGSAGIFGPSCELCAQLTAEVVNGEGGRVGRELRLWIIDGSRPPVRVANGVEALAAGGLIHAVVGWHIPAVRQAPAPRIAGIVPYVDTALHEGGERTPGVFPSGETPCRQLLPAMRWSGAEDGAVSGSIVGDDYARPRATAESARAYASRLQAPVVHDAFVPLGTAAFGATVEQVCESRADGVLVLLVGEDAVHLDRAFAARGLDARCRRLSTPMDEDMVCARQGRESTRGLDGCAGYFGTLATRESLDFGWRYTQRFGACRATLHSLGESRHEGVLLLSALARRSGTLEAGTMTAAAGSVRYAAPRDKLRPRARRGERPVCLAEAIVEFAVRAQLQGGNVRHRGATRT